MSGSGLKRFFVILVLSLLVLGYGYCIEISTKQLQELKGILQEYQELTGELKTTLMSQRATLLELEKRYEKQKETIEKLEVSYRDLSGITKGLENSLQRYRKEAEINRYIIYGLSGVIGLLVIALLFK